MPTSIVVGLDGSDASTRAADCAAEEAGRHELRLILACVVPWSPYGFTPAEENERRHIDRENEIRQARERVLDPIRDRVAAAGAADIDEVVRHGHPAETLVALAHEHNASRIVVGRTGQSRVRTLLFGSTPSHLIQISDLPVLVVP
jgi:nucleotide-binding universal stress UspA family protein